MLSLYTSLKCVTMTNTFLASSWYEYVIFLPYPKYTAQTWRGTFMCDSGPWTSHDEHTSPPFRFFMPMSPFPFLPFLFFFFLQQHFLMMQKQHVRMSKAATTAMAMMAQDGTEENIQNHV